MSGNSVTPRQVREALCLLYVPAKLAGCELAQWLPEARDIVDPVARAQAIRGRLLDAIGALRTGVRGLQPASASRAYECLRLRYVSGLSVSEVARRLAVSERQAYRDLRFAEEYLCSLLQNEDAVFTGEKHRPAETQESGVLNEELCALGRKLETVHLEALVRSAVETISPLAGKRGVSVKVVATRQGVMAVCTPAVLRELLIQVLSCLAQNEPGRSIGLTIESDNKKYATIVVAADHSKELARGDLLQLALKVAEVQGIEHELVSEADSIRLCLRLPLAKRRRVAIVEDNPGACALYERYLADSEWEPLIVPNPRLAVDIVSAKQVEVVVLDVMMAEMDGWDVLQALKLSPRTRSVPVIICSVVNDPELGLSLGAAAYLTKPVSRRDLLKVLRQIAQERTTAVGDSDMHE